MRIAPGFEDRQRFAARPFGIDDRRDLAVRVDGDEFGSELLVLRDVDRVDPILQQGLLEHDRDLAAVRRPPGVEIDHGCPLVVRFPHGEL